VKEGVLNRLDTPEGLWCWQHTAAAAQAAL